MPSNLRIGLSHHGALDDMPANSINTLPWQLKIANNLIIRHCAQLHQHYRPMLTLRAKLSKCEGGIKYSGLNLPFSYLTRYLLFLTDETSCFLVAAALLLLSQLSELKTILGGDTLYFQSSVNSMPASAAKPLRWAEIRGNILFHHHATGNNI